MRTLLQYPDQLPSPSTTTIATEDPSNSLSVDSDIIVILAALLCALICILGLALIARCAFFCRRPSFSNSNSNSNQQQQQQQHEIQIQVPVSRPNQGLKKKALKSLPKLRYGKASDDNQNYRNECVICLMDFEEGEDVRVLPMCGHEFHVGCIDTWLRGHSSCPSCRRILVVVAPPMQY